MTNFYSNINFNGVKALNCNNFVELREFTTDEIYEMFDMTEEQIKEIESIISDNSVANNKVWSSSKTNDEIKNAIIESNEYTDELISKILTITLDYTTDLSSITEPARSTMYILEKTNESGNVIHTLNLYNSNGEWIEVGDIETNLSYDNIYTKNKIDELLTDKANDNEVVHYGDIGIDYTKEDLNNLQVMGALSTKAKFDELEDKLNNFMNPSKKLCTISYNSNLMYPPMVQLLYYKNFTGYGIGEYGEIVYGGGSYMRYNPYLYTLEYIDDYKINIYVSDDLYFENPNIVQNGNFYIITDDNSDISITIRLVE